MSTLHLAFFRKEEEEEVVVVSNLPVAKVTHFCHVSLLA
jgi:hypothetical protein